MSSAVCRGGSCPLGAERTLPYSPSRLPYLSEAEEYGYTLCDIENDTIGISNENESIETARETIFTPEWSILTWEGDDETDYTKGGSSQGQREGWMSDDGHSMRSMNWERRGIVVVNHSTCTSLCSDRRSSLDESGARRMAEMTQLDLACPFI